MSETELIEKNLNDEIGNFRANTKNRDYIKSSGVNWLDFEEPIIAPVMGMRGSGKGGLMDHMAQKYYDNHFTILHIWSARSAENLYWVVNKNCKLHFGKLKKLLINKFGRISVRSRNQLPLNEEVMYIKLAERDGYIKTVANQLKLTRKGADLANNKLLHCNCDKAIPILLVAPDYVDFEQEGIDRFNGCYWKDIDEYHNSGLMEISSEDKKLLLEGNLLKLDDLRPTPLIKIKKITIPTTEPRKEKFRIEWTEAVLQAREEHRPLIMTPLMFEGMDKFEVVGEVFKFHTKLMNMSGHFKPLTERDVGKPEKYWSKRQKNWHKVVIFMNEARSVTPSSKMHGETGAGKSKRSAFDLVPEMRHMKTWYHTDFQNPSDIYDGIRPQSNFIIIKRTSLNLAGADFKWLFDKIENDRFGFMKKYTAGGCSDVKYLKHYESKIPEIKNYIDQRRPRISELASDRSYIVYENNEIRLIKNSMGRFHHKLSLEDAMQDTGVRWTVNRELKPEVKESKGKKEMRDESKKKKLMKLMIFKKMGYLRVTEKKNWKDVLDDLIQMENDGIVYGFDFKTKDGKWCSDRYRLWKKTFESLPE